MYVELQRRARGIGRAPSRREFKPARPDQPRGAQLGFHRNQEGGQ
ncbi:hypothetical protein J2785_007290 [Burkholderia ambifaria]|nr:hypothetical protein [Burkholderia ambifaria]MDR6504096.1 hypothetical protein [Burkholderia ambifaria]